MRYLIATGICALALGSCGETPNAPSANEQYLYDIVIDNGRVYNGSGEDPFTADIAIKDDRIATIGDIENHTAKGRQSVSLRRAPNTELSTIAAGVQDGLLFAIGNCQDKRFLEIVKQQGSKNPIGIVAMLL